MSLDTDMVEFTRRVAAVLQSRRRAAGLSMTRLAEQSGMSQQMVSFVERGARIPTIATLYRLATALGVETSELLAESERGRRAAAEAPAVPARGRSPRPPPSAAPQRPAPPRRKVRPPGSRR